MPSEAARDRQVARETVRPQSECRACNPPGPTDAALTEPQALMLAALAYVCRDGDDPLAAKAAPGQLARLRWPDSPAWNRRTRFGAVANQGAMGGTMPMKAATVLHRLADRGLARRVGSSYDDLANLWQPTERGLDWLAAHPTTEPSA